MAADSPKTEPKKVIVLGGYKVVSHIATGGMGAVYRAVHTSTGQEAALKVLTKDSAAKPALLERFRREARNASKLEHENIVRVFEFGEDKGTHYIAMEYVDGEDLHDYVEENGPLDPEQSRQVMLQAARALGCAHDAGIVHRDIKPSNFLLVKKGNRLLVKLTDLGLAREVVSDEFRVTRAGTTVGTVDYISPEQARDSGVADVRSDMYSLGCTWFHMLAGRPPFDKGGLAERLVKHIEAEPPDIREFNPQVSDSLAMVLKKLLAKKPEDRYQNPQELLWALNEMQAARRSTKAVTEKEPKGKTKKPPLAKKTKKGNSSPTKPTKKKASKAAPDIRKKNPGLVWGIVGGVAGVLILGGILYALATRGSNEDPNDPIAKGPTTKPPITPPKGEKQTPKNDDPTTPVKPPIKPIPKESKYKKLYEPHEKVDFSAHLTEMLAPWKDQKPFPEDAKVMRVSRLPESDDVKHSSLREAMEEAAKLDSAVVEIRDNGPLYMSSVALSDKKLLIRAGDGYRPMIVWDVARSTEFGNDRIWMKLRNARLELENLDVVVRWPAEVQQNEDRLFDLHDSDVFARSCIFSVAGKHSKGIPIARIQSEKTEPKVRATKCYFRGDPLGGFQVRTPGTHILIEESLLVCSKSPTFDYMCSPENGHTLSVTKSTLVVGDKLLRLTTPRPSESSPKFEWRDWDSLISRSSSTIGGELLTLTQGLDTRSISWKSVNTLVAGWSQLLESSSDPIQRVEIDRWRRLYGRIEGEVALREPWPQTKLSDVSEKPATAFSVDEKPVAFATSLDGDVALGCPVSRLPSTRDRWLGLTFEQYPSVPVEPLFDTGPPDIPAIADGKYHGERIDLNRKRIGNLGEYLEAVRLTKEFGPHVVLHLTGTGRKTCSPIRLDAGTSLTLYFEQPEKKEDELSLEFVNVNSESPLIELPKGNLDIVSGVLTIGPNLGDEPSHFVKINGTIRATRTAFRSRPGAYGLQSLIHLDGSGTTSPEKAHQAVFSDCVLTCATNALSTSGIGSRIAIDHSLVVSRGSTVRVSLGGSYSGNANTVLTLDKNTIAVGVAVVEYEENDYLGITSEPIVVRSLFCAYFDPFDEPDTRASLLRMKTGAGVRRGHLVWQSEGDAFDKRIETPARLDRSTKPIPQETWPQFWGAPAFRKSFFDVKVAAIFSDDGYPLHTLQLPKLTVSGDRKPGATLKNLGIEEPNKKNP